MRIYVNRRPVRYTPLYRQRRRALAHLLGGIVVLLAILWVAWELAGGL